MVNCSRRFDRTRRAMQPILTCAAARHRIHTCNKVNNSRLKKSSCSHLQKMVLLTVSDAHVKSQERHKTNIHVTFGLTPTERTSRTCGYHTIYQCLPNFFDRGPPSASKNNHGSSRPCSRQYTVSERSIQIKYVYLKTNSRQILRNTYQQHTYRGADKSLARPGRKQATAP